MIHDIYCISAEKKYISMYPLSLSVYIYRGDLLHIYKYAVMYTHTHTSVTFLFPFQKKPPKKTSPLPSMQLGTLAAPAVREDGAGGGLRAGAAGGAAAAGAGAGVGGAGPEEVPRGRDGGAEGGASVRGAGAARSAAGAGDARGSVGRFCREIVNG